MCRPNLPGQALWPRAQQTLLTTGLSSQDAVSGSAQKRLDKSTVDRAADSDVESVAADADVATVFAFAAAVVLSAAETGLEPVVAEAEGVYRSEHLYISDILSNL